LKVIAKGNELTAAYSLDSISCGSVIAFAMECFEHGLLTPRDTGGIGLRFGNGTALLQMIEQVSLRQDLGALLHYDELASRLSFPKQASRVRYRVVIPSLHTE